jgi:hypothetical protein
MEVTRWGVGVGTSSTHLVARHGDLGVFDSQMRSADTGSARCAILSGSTTLTRMVVPDPRTLTASELRQLVVLRPR